MKNSKINILERQTKLLAYLQKHRYATVADLTIALSVSPATVRRDLKNLRQSGDVNTFYGGTRLNESNHSLPVFDNERYFLTNISAKEAIAREAATLVESGDTIFINSSSTALRIIPYIRDKEVTIITNNARSLSTKRNPGTQLILIGGEVPNIGASTSTKMCTSGDYAVRMIEKITTTKCFIGVSGISAERGLSSMAINEPAINRAMLENCRDSVIVLADHRKVGLNHSYHFGPIDKVDFLITDNLSDIEEIEKLKNEGVKVIIVTTDNVDKL